MVSNPHLCQGSSVKDNFFFTKPSSSFTEGFLPRLTSCPGCANLKIEVQTLIFSVRWVGNRWFETQTAQTVASCPYPNPWVWIKLHHPLAGPRDTQQAREPLGVIPDFGNTMPTCQWQGSSSGCDSSRMCSLCKALPQNRTKGIPRNIQESHKRKYTLLQLGFPLFSLIQHRNLQGNTFLRANISEKLI